MDMDNKRVSRTLSDIPSEILSDIANRLPIIELLSFRGTCNNFRSASSTSSASVESNQLPWVLLHKSDSSECLIYNNNSQSKTYTRKIPDLENAICLASYDGWLLLFKDESIFFFCPFSLSKIILPEFPHKQIDGHVAAFSDAPTSPNCIVTVINRIDDLFVEINVICKGESAWTPYKIARRISLETPITGAIFDPKCKEFYYMDDGNSVLTWSLKDKKGKPYRIVTGDEAKNADELPYSYGEDVFLNTFEDARERFKLEENEFVDVCGITFEYGNGRRKLYLNEVVDDDSPTKTRTRRAVWIQPRFFQADASHRW